MIHVYDIQDELIAKLVADNLVTEISKTFKEKPDPMSKISYTESLLKKYEMLPRKTFNPKNNAKSIELRKKGNEFFSLKNRNYPKAIQLYNESICWAENDSENLAIGYANRSAIYFEWQEWQKCLENIELSRKCANFSENLKIKLEKREQMCKSKLEELKNLEIDQNNDHENETTFSLSYPRHDKIPFIANCLEMVENDVFGRYIITNRDLKIGDLIAIEESFCLSLQAQYAYQRCLYCLSENLNSLIPCNSCTRCMFCNETCRDKAYKTFHRFECNQIDGYYDMFNKIHISALRTVLKVFSDTDQLHKIKQFIDSDESKTATPFTINYDDDSISEQYKSVHTLVTNESKRPVADLFNRSIVAAMICFLIKSNEIIVDIFTDEPSNMILFYDLLYIHLQTSPTNFHSIDIAEIKNYDGDLSYSAGVYPFCSMINHACAPNVIRCGLKNNMIGLFVFRKISKNKQLFDNYG